MMNAIDGRPERDEEPAITLISVDDASYHLFEGEEFLNQLLLADGQYPKPVRCINFDSAIALSIFIGDGKSLSQYWGINPEIVTRLRETGNLEEIEAPQQ